MNRFILLITALLAVSQSTFAGGMDGNGGDPYETYAEAYPDQKKLSDAISLALQKVRDAKYVDGASTKLEVFLPALSNEIESLAKESKFLYIPLILDPRNSGPVADKGKIKALGALTTNAKGSHIYLTGKTLDYSNDQLAKLIIHETLHHFDRFKGYISNSDEIFVEAFAVAIMNGEITKNLNSALSQDFKIFRPYIAEGVIDRDQLFWMIMASFAQDCYKNARDGYLYYTKETCDYRLSTAEFEIQKIYPENLVNENVEDIFEHIYSEASFISFGLTDKYQIPKVTKKQLLGILEKLKENILTSGFSDKWSKYNDSFCKTKSSHFSPCSESNKIKFRDIIPMPAPGDGKNSPK
jgi:hypothetical protein